MTLSPSAQRNATLGFLLLLLLSLSTLLSCRSTQNDSIYRHTLRQANGQALRLSQLRGRVLLIVNTATHCGFTPQYEALEQLHERYAPLGLSILDFPCNQFGEQAPGTNAEIVEFCKARYAVQFPQMEKTEVNGPNAHPLFVQLKAAQNFSGFGNSPLGARMDDMLRKHDAAYAQSADIKWNFTKFLVDRRGRVVRRYEPTTPIDSLKADIDRLLAQP